MHRDDGADSLIEVVAHSLVSDVDGHKRALPVVAVDNIGLLRQGLEQFRHRAGEKAETLAVVIVAVELAAAEIRLVVNKVPRDAVALERKEPAVDAAPRKAHERPFLKVELAAPLVLHALVERQNNADLLASLGERLRKAAGHVRKAARLAKGDRLARHIQNVHAQTPFSRLIFFRQRSPCSRRAGSSRVRSACRRGGCGRPCRR